MSVEGSEDDRTIFCQVCKSDVLLQYCDDCGACPGNVFCGKCCEEIDMDGNPTLLCGSCDACKMLVKQLVFERWQEHRKQIQLRSVVVA